MLPRRLVENEPVLHAPRLGLAGVALLAAPVTVVADLSTEVPSLPPTWDVALALGVACVALWVWRWRRTMQLRTLRQQFEEPLGRSGARTKKIALRRADRIEDSLRRESRVLLATRARIRRQRARRAAAEAGLRDLEERYGLAIRGADDGIWEWDLRTDRCYFSARWKGLLGYAEQELSERVQEWWERVHPEDHERVLMAVKAHLEGRTPCLDTEHRVRHRDQTWRWFSVRASLVRDLAGEPSRLVGLVSDVTARRQVQQAAVEIADALSGLSGEGCLRNLVRNFARVLGVREAFVCQCSDFPTTRVRMLARWNAGDFARCVEFDLSGTACEDVIRDGRTVFRPRDAEQRWPLEAQFERHSYLGIPCLDSTGQVIGHVACADDKPMREELPQQAVLKIFAMRAAVEIERSLIEHELGGEAMAHLTERVATSRAFD